MEEVTYLGEEVVRCLNCGELSLKVSMYVYDAQLAGKLLIEYGRCDLCGFVRRDVSALELGGSRTLRIRVRSVKDLNALIVKSSSASIMIPELGIEITPGAASYGYVTTVEGILERVLDVMPVDCMESEECIKRYEAIREAIDGKRPFTLVIKDPSGRSAVVGNDLDVEVEDVDTGLTRS